MTTCEQCGERQATVKIMIQGKAGQEEGMLNLCQVCFDIFAKEHPDMKPAADFGAMMQAFLNMFNSNGTNINNSDDKENFDANIDDVKNKLLNLIGQNNKISDKNTNNKNININNLGNNTGAKKFNSKKWKKSLNKICPNCKSTSQRFITTGRLGCEKCYLSFKDEINEKLLTMTGENLITKSDKTTISVESKVFILKRDLNDAVEREDYELAAKIRDDIKVLVK